MSNKQFEFKMVDEYGAINTLYFTMNADVAWSEDPLMQFIRFLNGCGYVVDEEQLTPAPILPIREREDG